MKTLLLSLVVVAFMCLGSGQTRICKSCTGEWLCMKQEECKEGQKICFKKTTKDDFAGMKTVWGCADNCTNPGDNEKVTYCGSDNCNR